MKVWVLSLPRRRANRNLWQHLTVETNPQGVHLKLKDCEGEYNSGILKQQVIWWSPYWVYLEHVQKYVAVYKYVTCDSKD